MKESTQISGITNGRKAAHTGRGDKTRELLSGAAKKGRPANSTNGCGPLLAGLASFTRSQTVTNSLLSKMKPLQRLEHLLKALRKEGVSLSVLQAALNLHIRRHGDVNLKDLAGWLEVTTANITSVVDNLERLGLARRGASDMDRRQILISLTPDGESFVGFVEQFLAFEPTLAVGFSSPESLRRNGS